MSSQEKPRPPLPPEALSLPACYYTDPAHHQAELERFFFGMWIHAGRADQMPGVGDYVLRDVAGESVIVTRADEEDFRAYLQRLPPPRHAALRGRCGKLRRPDPLPLSRLGLRPYGPAGGRTPDGRPAAFPQGGLPAPIRGRRPLGRSHLPEPRASLPGP